MGAGIGAMHYTGMMAMQLNAIVRYDPILFSASIVVAVLLAILALQVRQVISKLDLDSPPRGQGRRRRADHGLRRDRHALHGDGLDLLLRRARATAHGGRSLGASRASPL